MDAQPTDRADASRVPSRRESADRRARPTPMVSKYLLVGRRREVRREDERGRGYVDRPGPWVLVAFGLVTLLSAADAYFTLGALARGGSEANPIMRAALELGNSAFVFVKTFVTIAGALFLTLHKNWALGRGCLFLAAVGYIALTAWHVYGAWYLLPA